jgi:pimeloyl-ACP methyl ester carboxylesterase
MRAFRQQTLLRTGAMMATTTAVPARPKGRIGKIFKWLLLVVVTLALCVAIAGMLYQAIGNWSDTRRFPQQGRSVNLGPQFGNTSLNIDCAGQGSPTVVMDTGLGVPAIGWNFVQPEIAKLTRVCSYDRAGYGWSSPGPMPRTSSEIAKELHALLVAAGEKPPYVLVAHSFGGYNVRVYTGMYPAEVAGLVLVDTSHEDQVSRMPASISALSQNQAKEIEAQRRMLPYLNFFGVTRWTLGRQFDSKLPGDFQEEFRYLEMQPKFFEATSSEILSFNDSAKEVHAAGKLGDRPLIVLTAGKNPERKLLPKTITAKDLDDFHEIWVKDLQVQEAHLSTRGKQQIVADSTHMIPFERPDTIINAIHEVWTAAKAPAAAPNSQ